MEEHGATAYLVNTGWNGTGKRISIKDTRGIIDAILDGSIDKAKTKNIPIFNLEVPTALPGVDPAILDPRDTYADAAEWDKKAKNWLELFIKNFEQYTDNKEGKGPGNCRTSIVKDINLKYNKPFPPTGGSGLFYKYFEQ